MGWNMNDLTNRTHGPRAEFAVSSDVYSSDGSQHVVFQGFRPTAGGGYDFGNDGSQHVVERWWTA